MVECSWKNLKNFTYDEFTCKCGCGTNNMKYAFMDSLQQLRTHVNTPFRITSGYRCDKHEKAIGGSGANHPKGRAVDLVTTRAGFNEIIRVASRFGFTGLGIRLHGSDPYIHLDTTHTTFTPWTYA